MRIAISGSHATGKSTLIAELARSLPSYVTVEEPYDTLVTLGHAFAERPIPADFEQLVLESCRSLTRRKARHVLFDRCAADYYAYLLTIDAGSVVTDTALFHDVADAMARLDLVVFVPVERPDRIRVDASESPKLRRRVDESLREMFAADAWGLGIPTLEVTGTPVERSAQVLAYIHALESR